MESNTSTHNDHNHNEGPTEEEEEEAGPTEEEEEEEEAGRESVVRRRRRVRVTALRVFVSYSSGTHEEISADRSVSHSTTSTHEEITTEYAIPYEADADTVNNVVLITILRGMGSTDSLVLPTDDDEESLSRQPHPDLPIEVIEGLLKKVEVVDTGDVCAICMDELKANDEARAIGHCSHTFHLDCVAEWVKRKPTCPLCRFEIPINGEGGDDQGVKRRRLV